MKISFKKSFNKLELPIDMTLWKIFKATNNFLDFNKY